jgi:endonuclease G
VAPVIGQEGGYLHYNNFSIMMHATRRLAIFTACNIDGSQWRQIPRGSDRWYFDPRLELTHQVGNDLYKSNNLDRGHLVRRLDPTWGDSYEAAKAAEDDTFFYTNCAPQHMIVNRRLWLGLENYILSNTNIHDMKVSVFGGPVFRDNDRSYRGMRIPEDFWKVVAYIRADTNALTASAYLLSQRDYLDDLEFAFGAYQTYQVNLDVIAELTKLDFGVLRGTDITDEAAMPAYSPITSLDMVRL